MNCTKQRASLPSWRRRSGDDGSRSRSSRPGAAAVALNRPPATFDFWCSSGWILPSTARRCSRLALRISASRSVSTVKAAKLLSPRSASPPDSGFTPWRASSSVAQRRPCGRGRSAWRTRIAAPHSSAPPWGSRRASLTSLGTPELRLTVAGAARTERSILNVTQHDVECPKIGLGGC